MDIQVSTAISDTVLMLATLGACFWLRRRGERYVSTGLMLVGVAAFIGALRFSINPDLADVHRFTSALATCTGLPLIAVQYLATCAGWPGRDGRMNTMGAAVVGFAAFGLAFPLPIYATAVGALSMLTVVVSAARCFGRHGPVVLAAVIGAVGVALAGLVIGTEGSIGPLLAIDVFHGVLALAFLGLAVGLPERHADWG